jgi:hypothetical protein
VEQADVIRQLAEGGDVSLAAWLGDPMSGGQAQQALEIVQQRLRSGHIDAADRFNLNLAGLICRYWAGQEIDAGYGTMAAPLNDGRERALLELCCGQLFMARRCVPAWLHLDRGFQLAAHLLEAEDYFRVLGRHTLLRQLPLASTPSTPASLETLLNEARVIARLRGPANSTGSRAGTHGDTID